MLSSGSLTQLCSSVSKPYASVGPCDKLFETGLKITVPPLVAGSTGDISTVPSGRRTQPASAKPGELLQLVHINPGGRAIAAHESLRGSYISAVLPLMA